MSKRSLLTIAVRGMSLMLAALTLALPPVLAQSYPTRTVKIVVPYTAGGGTDTMARAVAERLQAALGQAFVVENRPGASGNVGLEQVARSTADGYTLVMMPSNLSINPVLFPKVGYDAARDFAPIVLVGSSPVMVAGNPSSGIQNLADLVRAAKAEPGKLSWASCGNGTPQHIAGEMLAARTGISITHVPYKGCSQAIPDVLSGAVPIAFSTVANLSPHIRSGRLRGYAVTGAARSSHAPELPTVAEAVNAPGYDVDVWFGLLAPAATPREVIALLNKTINTALQSPELRQRMKEQHYEAIGGSPEAFAEVVQRDMARFGRVIREARITPD